jgi:Ca2+-binding RTX toxin-like protein
MAQGHGTENSDIITGTNESDTMWGNGGHDDMYGYAGSDMLYGGSGDDYLNGGSDRDTLVGGWGADTLVGGLDVGGLDQSTDYFRFWAGDSLSFRDIADTIGGWNVAYDYIDMPIPGEAQYYAEVSSGVNNIDDARSLAENSPDLSWKDHVFVYNRDIDVGYLVSDLDRNYSFETGVIISGAGSAYDMNWSDII